jgi:hypothetical protein
MLQVKSSFHQANSALYKSKARIGRDRCFYLKISHAPILNSPKSGNWVSKPTPVCDRPKAVFPSHHKSVKRPLHKQPFDELTLDLQKYIRENMLHSALRVLSEMLHRAPEERQRISSCLVASALGDIGFENFGLCLVVMQCLMGLTERPITPTLLCGLVKLMCVSPKTFMVSWLCDAHGTEQGRKRLRVLQPEAQEPPKTMPLADLIDKRMPHALTLLSKMPVKNVDQARAIFSHFDPYFSQEVVAMFERAFWKSHRRGRVADARLFLLTLPICVIKDGRQKPLILPAVEPFWDPTLINNACDRAECTICKNKCL